MLSERKYGLSVSLLLMLVFLVCQSDKLTADVYKHISRYDEEPVVTCMPSPVAVEDAEATSESEMKAYAEQASGVTISFDMVPIPGGTFMLGSPSEESDRNEDEGPQVELEVAPFWMGRCEVTWTEYEEFDESLDLARREREERSATVYDLIAESLVRPSSPYSDMSFGMGREDHPAIGMSQLAAKQYCKWLSARTGRYYRLPTEAEWEYACRAGTKTAYFFGDDPAQLSDYGWFYDNSEDGYREVGQLEANPWGLFDMHGNACEWCLDQYVFDRYSRISEGIDEEPFAVQTKRFPCIARGGSWYDYAAACRSASRSNEEGTAPSRKAWNRPRPCDTISPRWHTCNACWCGFRVIRPLELPSEEESRLYEPDPRILDRDAGKYGH
jgi:formylglycine-generating enzyme required for sulfatase activity